MHDDTRAYTSKSSTNGWSLEIGGTGRRSTAAFRTSLRSSFTADAGERKRVFLPLAARAKRYFVPSRPKAEGVPKLFSVFSDPTPRLIPKREALEVDTSASESIPGIELLASNNDGMPVDLAGDQVLYTFYLAGDTTGATAVFEYEYEHSASVAVKTGITTMGAEFHAAVSMQLTDALRLSCCLVSGYDYQLVGMREALGVKWVAKLRQW
jgi:hypothetical protein